MKRPEVHLDTNKTSNVLGTYALAGMLVLLLATFLFIKPSIEKASARKKELNVYRDHNAQLEQLERDTEGLIAESSVLANDEERIVTLVPPGNDEAGLVRILDGMARRTGVLLGSVSPTPVNTAAGPALGVSRPTPAGISVYPLTITIAGKYDEVFKFINAMENGPRVMDIRSVQFTTRSAGLVSDGAGISATLSVDTFTQSLPTKVSGGSN